MIWQDLTISVVNLLLVYSIIPQIYQGFKRKKGFITIQTSFITSIGLYVIAFAVFTLGLYFSSIVITVNATLWLVLLIQRIKYGGA